MKLSEVGSGSSARIVAVKGGSPFKKRLMEMGFMRGEEIYKVKLAPLADPAEYIVKGYHVSLRAEEADDIIVEPM
ncbi:MAG: ferrous iron transport protein A [Phycisphaerae bacterium]|nr:ferrous iron transport protein A [Phycisphaerae bacterium]